MALKETLLEFLQMHKGEVLSGEQLASGLNVTRAAVWKTVRALKEDGYQIVSHGGRGYEFTAENDQLSKTQIYAAAEDDHFDLEVFSEIDSTNTYARSIAHKAKDGTYIIANRQTAGRGRHGHSFYSPADTGLYVSYILKVNRPAEQILKLTVAAAVAVCEAIRSCTSQDPKIKWVNDIFLDHHKVAGILCEATQDLESHMVDSVIIGIGINCRTIEFPEEIENIAGSLGGGFSRSTLAGKLHRLLKEYTAELDNPALMDLYRRDS
ncbi:MAG: biotin--[Solobacterium sp.]|nr:biotin--[acetyl-CoA-carboxylase] ligase [Solobacterium sp.]